MARFLAPLHFLALPTLGSKHFTENLFWTIFKWKTLSSLFQFKYMFRSKRSSFPVRCAIYPVSLNELRRTVGLWYSWRSPSLLLLQCISKSSCIVNALIIRHATFCAHFVSNYEAHFPSIVKRRGPIRKARLWSKTRAFHLQLPFEHLGFLPM